MDVQLAGTGTQSHIEGQVDQTHLAPRMSLRPIDHLVSGVTGGHYGAVATTGLLAAQTAASSALFAVRFVSSTKLMVLLKLYASLSVTTA